ncbi:MAG TPA: Mur ligase family protein [Pyrinomonadaceae bacterium]|nr:Mur ligase family protein [Pyrinomonadaceae bacterium]
MVDEIVRAYLEKSARALDDIPHAGEAVYLRDGINLSTGGTAVDVTDLVHPSVAAMCVRAARVIGMDVCGVDLVLPDIGEPMTKGCGGVIELNASPGLRMHLYPSEGQPRDVGGAIVEMMYPPGAPSRIPIISVTGTNGKTTVTRMIGHVLKEAGQTVGMTTTDGIYIAGERIVEGDTTGPHSARTVLSDPAVEVAVLETARGGIVRRGLGYDWSDVAVLTNIQPDHIGQDGIETIEDILHIKSLVAERVKENGTLILNADDEHLARLAENPRVSRLNKRVVYFSLHENHLLVKKHRDAQEGLAYFVKDGRLVEAVGQEEHVIAHVTEIPATLGGAAEFNVANALAAAAACRAQGVTREQIASGLRTFRGDLQNPGRNNLYELGGGYVMLDYGHNPDAFKAVSRMTSLWQRRRVTGVIGIPGDRDDQLILEGGRVAARGFDRLIIKEDEDLRGRKVGEVAGLLYRAVKDEAPNSECHIVLNECDALRMEIERIRAGEVVVLFYDKLEPLLEVLKQYGATPAATVGARTSHASVAKA